MKTQTQKNEERIAWLLGRLDQELRDPDHTPESGAAYCRRLIDACLPAPVDSLDPTQAREQDVEDAFFTVEVVEAIAEHGLGATDEPWSLDLLSPYLELAERTQAWLDERADFAWGEAAA